MAEMNDEVFQELFGSWSEELPDVIDYQLMSLESTSTLIPENGNLHESTLENPPFQEEEANFNLRIHQLEQKFVTLVFTFFKLILFSQREFEMRINQKINELEDAQKRQKCYSKLLEKWTAEVQLILERLTKKLTDSQAKEQNPGKNVIHT